MTKPYAYTEWYDEEGNLKGRMLYNHDMDPEENVNLSEKPGYEKTVKELQARLFEAWPELGKSTVK